VGDSEDAMGCKAMRHAEAGGLVGPSWRLVRHACSKGASAARHAAWSVAVPWSTANHQTVCC
jgi:hypothetical protein